MLKPVHVIRHHEPSNAKAKKGTETKFLGQFNNRYELYRDGAMDGALHLVVNRGTPKEYRFTHSSS